MKRITPLALAATTALLLAGCGAGADSAKDVAQKVADKHGSAAVTEYTAENDPNGLLGKSNGYTEAANVKWAECDGLDVSCGATVEVWKDKDAAKQRAEYIQNILGGAPALGSEWTYVDGSTVLRITGDLTEEQAKDLNVIDGDLVTP